MSTPRALKSHVLYQLYRASARKGLDASYMYFFGSVKYIPHVLQPYLKRKVQSRWGGEV